MTLTREQFDTLVQQLETYARKYPSSYRLRVGLLAALGYAYIFLVLAGVITLLALVVMLVLFSRHINAGLIKIAFVLLILVGVLLRSLWVTFPKPDGIRLVPKQTPHLFRLVNELTTKLNAPRFHHILLTRDFNAAVLQVPRLGIFGWQQNYLIVGLPLMQALTLEQFRAVLAHEIGHLSGNHSRFAGWIYRVRKTWMQIYERLCTGDGGFWLFDRFFNWYSPFFGAYSFVLARMNEYEADRCAAELAGAQTMADALLAVEVKSRFLDHHFWSDVYKQVEQEPDPPGVAYTRLLTALRNPIKTESGVQWLQQALVQKTGTVDTHPCLSDRLTALGCLLSSEQGLCLPEPMQQSAADSLFGKLAEDFAAEFDHHWQQEVSTTWRQRYVYVQEALKQLETLEQKIHAETATLEDRWQHACLIADIRGNKVAMPLMQDFLAQNPDHAIAHYTVGQLLLQESNATGVKHIEAAIKTNPEWAVEGYQLIYGFYWQQGQTKEAKQYQQLLDEAEKILVKAQQERATVTDRDTLKPHTFKDSELEPLIQQLSDNPKVQAAHLVEKIVHFYPNLRFCVLGVTRKKDFIESESAAQQFVDDLANTLHLPSQGYILILNHGGIGKLKKMITQVERSQIFHR